MRIALINIKQETNDFNPKPTTLVDFRAFGLHEGQKVIETQRGIGEIGGYLNVVEASGLDIETVPILRARSVAGGRIDMEARRFFLDRIRVGLEAAGPLDALMLQLHGACAGEGEDDIEGEQAALCREILGPDVPIMLTLDHHASVTRRIMRSVTAIVGHRTQPHNQIDTGTVGTELLMRMLTERLKPTMARRRIPLLSHQEQFLTSKPPMKIWFDRARAMEAADPRVLQVAPFPMQPWLDVAEGGWTVVVVTNDDPVLAETLADEMADLAWSMREDFQKKDSIPIDDAIRLADETERGVVSLSDTGDTVAGGAAGDSNVILEAILRIGIKGRALMSMADPVAVKQLYEAGVGATQTVSLGGRQSGFFEPLTVTGVVRGLGDGKVSLAEDGKFQRQFEMGRTVVFEVGPVTLLLSEMKGAGGNNPSIYRTFGIEPADYKMAVLKTASNFQYFAPISSRLIRVDTRGPGQSDISSLPWKRIPRPIYPLDDIASWREPV